MSARRKRIIIVLAGIVAVVAAYTLATRGARTADVPTGAVYVSALPRSAGGSGGSGPSSSPYETKPLTAAETTKQRGDELPAMPGGTDLPTATDNDGNPVRPSTPPTAKPAPSAAGFTTWGLL